MAEPIEETFDVFRFFDEQNYDAIRKHVRAEEAVHVAYDIISRANTVVRVIITDRGDNIVWEWIKGKGVVFPPNSRQR